MTTLHLTEENFEAEVLQADRPVVVDFWATWCMPCKQFGPIFEAAAEEYAGKITMGKIDVDEHKKLAIKYKVLSIPTVIMFKNGEVVQRHSGGMTADEFKAWIEALS